MIEITTTIRGVPMSVRARIVTGETTDEEQAEFPDAVSATVEDIEIAFHEGGDAEMLGDFDGDFDLDESEMRGILQELLAAYVKRGGDA